MRARNVSSLVLASILAVAAAAAEASPRDAVAEAPARGNGAFDVASWNLYIGFDVDAVLDPGSTVPLPQRIAAALASVQATDFAERAGAIADELAPSRPIAIGLQEAAYWETPLGTIDYVELLRAALAERGLEYDVASVVTNVDLSLPVPVAPGQTVVVRMVDRDAVLVRSDVQWRDPAQANYRYSIPVEIGDPPVLSFDYLRGWASVEVRHRGEWLRFLTTHLEAFSEQVRFAQATELLGIVSASSLPVVAVGDFNALPGTSPTYDLVASALTDVATAVPREPRPTCCVDDPLLRSPEPTFDERIDLVLYDGPFAPVQATVVGDRLQDRTATGLWPSDHAGIVAKLRWAEPQLVSPAP